MGKCLRTIEFGRNKEGIMAFTTTIILLLLLHQLQDKSPIEIIYAKLATQYFAIPHYKSHKNCLTSCLHKYKWQFYLIFKLSGVIIV